MASDSLALPPLSLRQRAPRVADAVVAADGHVAGLRYGGLARRVDGRQLVAATLGATVRVNVARGVFRERPNVSDPAASPRFVRLRGQTSELVRRLGNGWP